MKKIILITGCSSGFGMHTAAILSKKHIVYATMRNTEKSAELLNLVKKYGGEVIVKQLDVCNVESIKNVFYHIEKNHGKLDVLVNNAGYGIGGCFEDLSDKEFRDVMETNFFGVLNVTRIMLPLIHKSKKGKIINLSSVAGRVSYPVLGAYNSSKYALEGFSESIRYELKPFRIDVVLVEPGSFDTKIFEENAKICDNFFNEQSRYFKTCQSMYNKRSYVRKKRPGAEVVAEKLVKIIEKNNVPFRVIVGADARFQIIMKWFLPFKLFEKIVFYFSNK